MDIKQLEQLQNEVYKALKEEFSVGADDCGRSGKHFCAVPPGILIEILETLIVPVVTALVAELLIRRFIPQKDAKSGRICKSAQMLKLEAEKQIDILAEEVLTENQASSSVVQNISAKVILNIEVTSSEEGENLLFLLKQYFNESK